MKRKRLQGIGIRLEALASSSKYAASLSGLYYIHDSNWYVAIDGSTAPISIGKDLQAAFKSKNDWHRRSSTNDIYYRHGEYGAVSLFNFTLRPSAATVGKFQKELVQELENANNEFFANHDSLTESLNKGALDRVLLDLISEGNDSSLASLTSAEVSNTPAAAKSVFLVSMDLDHFKSVNDNFGHLYGDLVLRAFSWRIDAVLETWMAEKSGNTDKAWLARPGGEEFQIVIAGDQTTEEVVQLAERIRAAVSSGSLPSQHEFEVLESDGKCEIDKLPTEAERNVTVSIGISILEARHGEKAKQSIARMLREADLALYSAKGGGRNRVRLFSEILRSHGRVIESIKETELVAIDIGAETGVKLGQEFIVYPANFSGDVPYFAGEGRSRKRVGIYPKYPIARVAVINVQTEVSFCKVEQWLVPSIREITAGSNLEAIPLGSISHLVSKPDKSLRTLATSVDALRTSIRSDTSRPPTASVLLKDLHEFAAAKGLFSANQVLATIFEVIGESVPGKPQIAMIGENAFTIVSHVADYQVFHDGVSAAASKIVSRIGDEPAVRFGIFDPSDYLEVLPEHGIELSMLAAVASEDPLQPTLFSEVAASQAFYVAIKEKKFESTRADVRKLFEIGLRTPMMLNQAALVEYADPEGDLDAAEKMFMEAFSLEPDSAIYGLNIAVTRVRKRDWMGAFEIFSQVDNVAYYDNYKAAYALTCLELLESGSSAVSLEKADELVKWAVANASKSHAAVVPETVMKFGGRLTALRNRGVAVS